MKTAGIIFFAVLAVVFGVVAIVSSYRIADDWRYGFAAAFALGFGTIASIFVKTFQDLPKATK